MESNGGQELFSTHHPNLPIEGAMSPNSKEQHGSSGILRRIKRAAFRNTPSSAEAKESNSSGKSRRGKIQRTSVDEIAENVEETKIVPRDSAKRRAEEFRVGLGTDLPSCFKILPRSSITAGFCLVLPSRFCKLCMPNFDTTLNLEDTNGGQFTATYIGERGHVSGGWKRFCATHNLSEGDIVIFQLVKALHLKVYIIKENKSLGNETHATSSNSEDNKKNNEVEKGENGLVLDEMACAQSMMLIKPNEKGIKNSANGDPKRIDKVKLENFQIVVRDSVIDSEISEEQRAKYYDLCCKQNINLHENLLQGISSKLAAEMIIGILNIYESMKATEVLGSGEKYAVWDRTLMGFELLGMNVEFLRARLNGLMKLANDAEEAIEMESMSIRLEQARISEEMNSLQCKLSEMAELKRNLCSEMDTLRPNAEKVEALFVELRDSPW